MNLSVFTVSTPDLTPQQLIETAKEVGLQGIEWRYKDTPEEVRKDSPSFWGNNLCTIEPSSVTDEELDAISESVRSHGLTTLALAPYLTTGDIEGTELAMKHASRLGAKMVRVGVPRYDRSENYNDLFKQEIAYLEQVQELSKTYGVKAVIETHHVTIAPSASLAHRIVSGFDPDHIGVLYDPGNMVYEGYENYRMGLELLGPYLAHVHVKNAAWVPGEKPEDPWTCRMVGMDRGIVDWLQVLKDLKAVGYDGWFGVEDFSNMYSSKEMMQKFVTWFQALAEQV